MKFAPNLVFMLLLCIGFLACRNQPDTHQKANPVKEAEVSPVEKSEEKKERPIKINEVPKEQKSDRRNHKNRSKNELDTLRPKTA